ncbi:hypothetical protein LWP59_10095 [Amycolatopsis acidiphila]|uniref:hypothetical protein n=1 Tax=Amycolatopsis acidiphila TaxID=715473 RepID=UPI001F21E668|nr:hypothetical protein [Amycolatopsis acidiphila]UIJ61941.1 hypothetical protein LWP59_10095 [Amycolatopsis acidiphila]
MRGEPALAVLRDRPYAVLALVNAVMLLYMPMLSLVVPLWIAHRTVVPHWLISVLLMLNTVSVALFQVRVAWRVTGPHSAARFVRYAGLALLASCAVFALSATGGPAWAAALILLGAVGLQVIGELLLASGAWEIGFGLAPEDKQGQYQGFYGAGVPVARMLGPLLLTGLVLTLGPVGWLVLGALFATAGCATMPAVRWANGRIATR